MGRARDGCVVESAPLARLLTQFFQDWNRDRPTNPGTFGAEETRQDAVRLGAMEWLSTQTRIPRGTITNIITYVIDPRTGTQRPRYHTTELWIADAIVSAIGCPQVFHNGTLVIYGNRNVKPEKRGDCCGHPVFKA